ncbi:MAG: metalloregulator ArsR/SmtB family transcription factor [Pseudonocardiales bacterium]
MPTAPALCCSPLTKAPLSLPEAEGLAHVLKAVADPTRLRLLSIVAAHQGGEACVCDLTDPVALTQPTVSHHLRVLVDAGLLTREQRGKWAYYRLVDGALRDLAGALNG